jgi:tetratricopeptide (TPR) repeat protein
LESAFQHISQSLELRRQTGFTVAVPYALIQKAEFIAQHYGQEAQAVTLLEEGIDIAEQARSTRALSSAQMSLANLQLARNNISDAISFLECALENARKFGDQKTVVEAEKQLAAAHQRQQ